MEKLWLVRLEDRFAVLCSRHFIEFVENGGQPKPLIIHPDLYGLLQRGCDRCRTYSFDDVVKMLTEECGMEIEIESGAQSSFGDDGPVTRITLGKKPPQ